MNTPVGEQGHGKLRGGAPTPMAISEEEADEVALMLQPGARLAKWDCRNFLGCSRRMEHVWAFTLPARKKPASLRLSVDVTRASVALQLR